MSLDDKFRETEIGKIPGDWILTTANDFCVKVADGTHSTPKPTENGKFLVTSKHIKGGKIDLSSAYRISDDDFDEINKRSKVNQWDVLFSMIGTVGEIALINHVPDFAIKNVGLFKCGEEFKAKWLYYFLCGKIGQDEIKRRMAGTTQSYVTLGDLRTFPIVFPSSEQELSAIITVLSSLDDKIELLREENKTLEATAQAIYKEWFVNFNFPCLPENYKFSGARKPDDFEQICTYKAVGGLPAPQPDKYFVYVIQCEDDSFYIGITDDLYYRWYQHKVGEGARWTKANSPVKVIHYEEFTSRKEAAEREKWLKTGYGRKWLKREFKANRLRQAGKMIDSELGEIPEGWRVGKLVEEGISKFVKTGISFFEGTKDYVATANVNLSSFIGPFEKITYSNRPSRANMQPVENSIWFARMAESRKYLLFQPVDEEDIKTKILSTGFAGISCDINYLYFYWCFIISDLFDKYKKQFAEGAVQVAINNTGVQNILLVLPPVEISAKFTEIIEPLFKKISHNKRQIQTLSSLRDTLLPKLMRGEIRVKGFNN